MTTDPVLEHLKREGVRIDVYSVGLLSDLYQYVHNPDRRAARPRFRAALRRPVRLVRAGNWRAFRNYFNGYLAEHPTLGTRAGRGWTRGRALRDLARHLIEVERSAYVNGILGKLGAKPVNADGSPYSYAQIVEGGWSYCDGCRQWGQGASPENPHDCPGTFMSGPVSDGEAG
ncbi:hypothetical protein ACFV6B_13045 [Streptomyces microflavus]|uniref:hypothetical protein n=1 Tax=Streptomyces microflavus TaxID=1919 RepID=UPI003668BDCC